MGFSQSGRQLVRAQREVRGGLAIQLLSTESRRPPTADPADESRALAYPDASARWGFLCHSADFLCKLLSNTRDSKKIYPAISAQRLVGKI